MIRDLCILHPVHIKFQQLGLPLVQPATTEIAFFLSNNSIKGTSPWGRQPDDYQIEYTQMRARLLTLYPTLCSCRSELSASVDFEDDGGNDTNLEQLLERIITDMIFYCRLNNVNTTAEINYQSIQMSQTHYLQSSTSFLRSIC